MNWYMIKTKDTYVSKLCIFLFLFFYFDVSSGVGLWLVNTYQYGCDPSVLSHHAPGTVEWDESYCIDGNPIWSSRCGEFFYHESYCDERVVMNFKFQIFWWRQFRGVGLYPYMAYGRDLPIYGDAATPRVFWGTKTTTVIFQSKNSTSIMIVKCCMQNNYRLIHAHFHIGLVIIPRRSRGPIWVEGW